jgi:hypothetical protein
MVPWKIRNGLPVQEVKTGLTPPEVTIEVDGLVCPYCGKEYKTERGLDNHLTTH